MAQLQSTSITGSLIVTQGITGSFSGSATNAISASYAATASYALNAGDSIWTGSAGNIYYSGGNVGIGTASPAIPRGSGFRPMLHVYNNSSGTNPAVVVSAEDNQMAGYIAGDNAGGSDIGWGWNAYYQGSGNNFYNIRIGDNGTWTDRFTIDRYGNVGIGTTNPARKLSIVDGAGPQLRLSDGTANTFWEFYSVYYQSNQDLIIQNQNGSAITINSGGNVGIGATIPSQKLHVVGNQYITGVITVGASGNYSNVNFVRADGAGVGSIGWRSDGSFYVGGHPDYGPTAGNRVRVYGFGELLSLGNTQAGDVVNINTSGNVGIGTTSPIASLDNQGSAGTYRQRGVTTMVTDSLGASGTQARRYEIARVTIDYNDWNSVGPIEIEVCEKYWSQGLRKKYTVYYGYVSTSGINLTEMTGFGQNNFQVTIGSEVVISGDLRYIPIYVDVRYYAIVTAILKTNRDLSTSNPPGAGGIWVNNAPSGTNISDFTADSVVYVGNLISGNSTFSTGNVGIGTTSPETKLHVASGDVLISNGQYYSAEGSTGGNYKLAGVTAGNVVVIGAIDYTTAGTIFAGGDNISITTGGAAGTSRLNINSAGNVSIGTTSTVTYSLLNVAGGINATGVIGYNTADAFTLNGKIQPHYGFSLDPAGSTPIGISGYYGIALATEGSERMRILGNGNVGIGTTNPATKLEVYSSANATTFTITSDGANEQFRIRRYSDTNKQLLIGYHSSNYGTIQVVEQAVAYRALALQAAGGNVGIGITNPSFKLHVVGVVGIGQNTNGTATIDAYGGNAYYGCDGTQITVNGNSGNVGIGITTPAYKLDVIGNSRVYGNYLIVDQTNGYNTSIILNQSGLIQWYMTNQASTGKLVFGNGNGDLVWIGTTGNVGIGTSSPTEKLDVAGIGKFTGTNVNVRAIDGTIITKIQSQTVGGTQGAVGTESNNDLSIVTNNTTRMLVTAAGNVGIGTTAPLFNLQVGSNAGTIATTTIRLQNSYLDTNGYYGFNIDAVDNGVSGHDLRFLGRSSPTGTFSELVRIKNTGNVGIGTTSPSYKLDVNGNARANSVILGTDLTYGDPYRGIAFGSNADGNNRIFAANNTADGMYFAAATGQGFNFRPNGGTANLVVINSSGNVGINTTSPSAKFEVAGKSLSRTTDSGWGQSAVANPNDTEVGFVWAAGGTGYPGVDSTYTRQWIAGLSPFGTGTDRWSLTNKTLGANTAITVLEAGNIGIGTTNPGYKLEVVNPSGNASIGITAASGYQTALELKGSDRWYRLISQPTAGNGGRFDIYDQTAGAFRLSINTDGNVGIGTTSPGYKLEVGGTLGVSGNATFNGGNVYINSDYSYIGNNTTDLVSLSGGTMYLPGNGNVGIGTTSPGYKLDINGVTRFQDRVRFANDVWNLSGDGYNRFYFANVGRTYFGSGNGYEWRNASDTGVAALTNNGYFIIGAVNSFTTGGTATLSVVGDTISLGASDSDLAYFRRLGTGQFQWQTYNSGNTGQIHLQPYGGNVGIGTTSPASRLEVGNFLDAFTNSITVSGRYEYVPQFTFRLGQSGTNYDWIGGVISCGDDGNYNGIINFKTANAGRDTPTTKMVIKASGNVGIGTTSPSQKLHLYGSGNQLLFIENTGTYHLYTGLSSNVGIVGSSNATPLSLQTNGVSRVYLDTTGNVGIGTGSPSNKLEVYTSATAENVFSVNNGTQRLQLGVNNSEGSFVFEQNSYALRFGTANTERMRITADGNIGIGTTSPSQKLDVNGYIVSDRYYPKSSNNTYIYGNSGGLVIEGSGYFYVPTSGGSYFEGLARFRGGIYNDGNTYLQINGGTSGHTYLTGNVGIGTTNPGAKLDVVGAALFGNTASGLYVSPSQVHIGGTGTAQLSLEDVGVATAAIALDGNTFAFGHQNSGPAYQFKYSNTYNGNYASTGTTFVQFNPTTNYINSGNVGIGTTNPGYKLHVEGTSWFTNEQAISYTNSIQSMYGGTGYSLFRMYGNSNGVEMQIDAHSHNSGAATIGTYSNSDIFIKTNQTNRIVVKAGGSVGIGTTNPVQALHVVGSIYQRTGDVITWSNGDAQIGAVSGYALAFSTYNGSSAMVEHLRITSTGNVGIGVTAPAAKLQVSGSSNVLNVRGSGSAATSSIFSVDGTNGRLFEVSDDLSNSLFSVNTIAGLPVIEAFADYTVTMGTYGAYTLQVTGSRVGVGTSSPGYPLHVSGSVSGISIYATNDIAAFSDQSVKTDLQVIDSAVDRIKQINGYTYVRVDDLSNTRRAGVIAQEVQKVLPEVVSENQDGTLNVAYSNMIALLIEGMKEQQSQIDELKQRLDNL